MCETWRGPACRYAQGSLLTKFGTPWRGSQASRPRGASKFQEHGRRAPLRHPRSLCCSVKCPGRRFAMSHRSSVNQRGAFAGEGQDGELRDGAVSCRHCERLLFFASDRGRKMEEHVPRSVRTDDERHIVSSAAMLRSPRNVWAWRTLSYRSALRWHAAAHGRSHDHGGPTIAPRALDSGEGRTPSKARSLFTVDRPAEIRKCQHQSRHSRPAVMPFPRLMTLAMPPNRQRPTKDYRPPPEHL
jgi:hypothetical protein